MQNERESPPSIGPRGPSQAEPVIRSVVSAAVSCDTGIEACDNDHNTDTERDIFFVKMT